ncbi:MAG: GDP-mannose 4,6-dehydratase [Chloroflexi bacterium]|nr:GDP-mannose 4,6-dehydratase [Chloroflexota bacterium]
MQNDVVLITGANGEIGHGLITFLGEQGQSKIVALDLQEVDVSLQNCCETIIQGDILDRTLLGKVFDQYQFSTIYHLASILSTKAEYNPELAHRINVEGTLNLLQLATAQSQKSGASVKFLYPSSIAAYGLPDLKTKAAAGHISETEWCFPTTMYGCNKLYCEHLGRYYATHYRQLVAEQAQNEACIDFRCLRFPGLISAMTVPTGGTSDYGPEMLHHAAQGLPYVCFVRPDTRLPFMVMPDAIKSLLALGSAPRQCLTQFVYNVTSFSPTAQEFYEIVRRAFPQAEITFAPHSARQNIVDSWPADVDDSAARRDWGWAPDFDQRRAFDEYLIPAVQKRYAKVKI